MELSTALQQQEIHPCTDTSSPVMHFITSIRIITHSQIYIYNLTDTRHTDNSVVSEACCAQFQPNLMQGSYIILYLHFFLFVVFCNVIIERNLTKLLH